MNKKIIIGTSLTALAIGILVPVAISLPASAYNGPESSSLVDQLVSKFNLNKDEVQNVFSANRTEREAKMQTNQTEKIATAVQEEKITQTQADTLSAKLAEMKTERENNHEVMVNKTEAERKAFMESRKAEMDTWAKENNIDVSYLGMMNGGRQRGAGNR